MKIDAIGQLYAVLSPAVDPQPALDRAGFIARLSGALERAIEGNTIERMQPQLSCDLLACPADPGA